MYGIVREQLLVRSDFASILVSVMNLTDVAEDGASPYESLEWATRALALHVAVNLLHLSKVV